MPSRPRPYIGRDFGFTVRRSDDWELHDSTLEDLRRYDFQSYEREMIERQQRENQRMAEQEARHLAEAMRYSSQAIDAHEPAVRITDAAGTFSIPAGGTYSISSTDWGMYDSAITTARIGANTSYVQRHNISAEALIEQMHELFCVGLCNYCAGETREKVEALAKKVV